MRIADIEIGQQYGLAHPGNEPVDAYAKATVTAKGRGGIVTVATNTGQQEIGSKYIVAPWDVCAEAKRERRLLDQENERRFDRRGEELEAARQRIVEHLTGTDIPYLAYDLSLDSGLGKPVKAHSDRSGYWTGTRIALDYVQIAALLDAVASRGDGDPDRTTDLSGESL